MKGTPGEGDGEREREVYICEITSISGHARAVTYQLICRDS
jgi:hypothetical protein